MSQAEATFPLIPSPSPSPSKATMAVKTPLAGLPFHLHPGSLPPPASDTAAALDTPLTPSSQYLPPSSPLVLVPLFGMTPHLPPPLALPLPPMLPPSGGIILDFPRFTPPALAV
ncbi:unnamed protein product [Closterium sp. Naga37s-1]|nr:unnamed protein product [Closterium sp. Naga37s-1]